MKFIINSFDIKLLYLWLPVILLMLLKPRSRFWLLRFSIYISLFLIILEPGIILESEHVSQPSVNVYIDNSISMSMESRLEEAKEHAIYLNKKLSSKLKLSFFTFGDDIKPISVDKISKITSESKTTNIAGIFTKKYKSDAKLIISDGSYNAGDNPLSMRELKYSPVISIVVGSDISAPNISIEDLYTPGLAFRDENIDLEFSLANASKYSGPVYVYLKEGKKRLSSKKIYLNGKKKTEVKLSFEPQKIGLINYSLEVTSIKDELDRSDNELNFQLQIKRQKIRILYVSGQPSWEYSYFRRLVKSDPQIELLTFLILRNPDNISIVSDNELSLIHFPAREMFTEKIYDFDLLIYENFSYNRFFPRSYLNHIKKFVEKGGGFIVLGGEDSFSSGVYNQTSIADILPVHISEKSKWQLGNFIPKLNGDIMHPMINIAGDPLSSKDIWDNIPELDGYDPFIKAKSDAKVLLKTNSGVPVLVVNDFLKGRVMLFNTNTTWKWAMGFAAQGKTAYYYNRFWQKAIRYMIGSEEERTVQVFPDKNQINISDQLGLNIKILDNYLKAINSAEVKVFGYTPSNKKIPLQLAQSQGADGWYRADIILNEPGINKIVVKAYSNSKFIGTAQANIKVEPLNRELSLTAVNKDLMQAIAKVSSGYYSEKDSLDVDEILKSINRHSDDNTGMRKISWHNAFIALLLIFIVILEWYLVKKWENI